MAIRHTTLLSAALGAVFMLSSTAEACTLQAWLDTGGVQGTPDVGGPAEVTKLRRYSGLYGMAATGDANYVWNDSPANDPIFRARFYVYTAEETANGALVYQAGGDLDAGEIQVLINNNGTEIAINHRGGDPMTFVTTANRWYSVEVAMNSTADATEGDDPIAATTLIGRVGGGGMDSGVEQSTGITALDPPLGIDSARLGCVSGCGIGVVNFEEYESTRSPGTRIGRLCRGNANADTTDAGDGVLGLRNVGDIIAIRNEFLSAGANPAPGTPDMNEDGFVNVGDIIGVRNAFLGGQTACIYIF